jgi:hypothetical protein
MQNIRLFCAHNPRLLRFFHYCLFSLILITVAAWICSYFYCTNLNVYPAHKAPSNVRNHTLSLGSLCGKIYCYDSNFTPFTGNGPVVVRKIYVFTSHYRIYLRRHALKDPWGEFMGFQVIHFSVHIWILLLGEGILFFSVIALQRSCSEIDALSGTN